MRKVLLTGGEGFIGNHIKKVINCYSYDLINGDDIRDKFKLDSLMQNEKFDLIINLSARAGVKFGELYPDEYISTNVNGLMNIIYVAKKYSVRLIHFSSSSVFKQIDRPLKEDDIKEPVSVYGITKLMGEMLIKKSGIDYTIIRPFTVVGENGRKGMIIDRWKQQILKKQPVTFYGDGSTCRGYTYVGDLVDGVINCVSGDYNIGGDQIVTLNDMWKLFKEEYPKAERIMCPLASYDVSRSIADTSKAYKVFGWKPKTNIFNKIRELIK